MPVGDKVGAAAKQAGNGIMTTIVMVVEGVLQQIVGGQELREGCDLYHCFHQGGYDIILVSPQERNKLSDWIYQAGLIGHTLELPTIEHAIARSHVSLVVTPDPQKARQLFEQGVTSLLFAHPSYADPAWRPDYVGPMVGWNELSRAVAEEATRKVTDGRMGDGA